MQFVKMRRDAACKPGFWAETKQLMQGSGKVHRHVQLRTNNDLKQPGLKPLLKAALDYARRGKTLETAAPARYSPIQEPGRAVETP